jgi:hypothetical protein
MISREYLELSSKNHFRQFMFGLVVNGRPVILPSQPGSGIVQDSSNTWTVDITNPGQVRLPKVHVTVR